MKGHIRRLFVLCGLGLGSLAVLVLTHAQDRAPASEASSSPVTTPETTIRDWPEPAQAAARMMIDEYGQPNDFNDGALVWRDNGPWKRTIVHRYGLPGPREGQNDVLQQAVTYRVPLTKFQELAHFDDRIATDRTRNELSFRSDSEKKNFLALNLADEIIANSKDVEAARQAFAEGMELSKAGKISPYTEGLRFRFLLHDEDAERLDKSVDPVNHDGAPVLPSR
jgi:hypothetical protein